MTDGAGIVEDSQLHDTIGPKWCAEIAARIDAAIADARKGERERLAQAAARIYQDDEIGADIAAAILADPRDAEGG